MQQTCCLLDRVKAMAKPKRKKWCNECGACSHPPEDPVIHHVPGCWVGYEQKAVAEEKMKGITSIEVPKFLSGGRPESNRRKF
jgi:hypothetical protein